MSANQILPVNNQITASGLGTKANGIVQIQQPQQSGAWILADNGTLYMNGLIVPSGGGLDRITSPDQTSQVRCLNNDEIQMTGQVQGITTKVDAYIQSDGGGASMQLQNQVLNLNAEQAITLNTVSAGINLNSFSTINLAVQDESNISISCANGTIGISSDIINLNGDDNITMACGANNQNCGTCDIQANDYVHIQGQNLVSIESNAGNVDIYAPSLFNINGIPSSEYQICYGQAKSPTNSADFGDVINYDNPEVGQPQIQIQIWRLPDFQMWFDHEQYNRPDNHILTANGDGFRWSDIGNNMIEIEINFQLYYTFDGSYPSSYVCCGLFDRDTQTIIPQSIRWFELNDIKFKYITLYTNFTMKTDEDHQYIPFFSNTNHAQLQVYDFGGNSRCWIKFKKYQFITY